MARLRAREYKRHGERIREGGDMYEESTAFLVWAERYDDPTLDEGRSRKMHEDWLKEKNALIERIVAAQGRAMRDLYRPSKLLPAGISMDFQCNHVQPKRHEPRFVPSCEKYRRHTRYRHFQK